jgi:hypothetical protein
VLWSKSWDELLAEMKREICGKDHENTLCLQEEVDASAIVLDLIKGA